MSSELDEVRRQLNKDADDPRVIKGSEYPNSVYLPTGVFLLDLALLGGFHDGRATMLYGVEGSGKSTLGYLTLIAAQKKYPGSRQVLLDLEHMWEANWFRKLGGDPDRIELLQPRFAEEGLDDLIRFLGVDVISAVMVDSVATIVPKAKAERSSEDFGVGERARLAGDLCEKILCSWSEERNRGHRCTVVLINQYRDDIGKSIGDPRKLPGGWQINYFAKTRVQMRNRKHVCNDKGEMGKGNIPHHNLHSFKLSKDKGAGILDGEFKMVLSSEHHPRGLDVGTVDDLNTVGTWAKKLGIIHGGGQSWKCDGVEAMHDPDKDPKKGAKLYDPNDTADAAGMEEDEWQEALANWPRIERPFRTLAEMEDYLYHHPEDVLRIKQQILVDVRLKAGMPALPPDGYLLDWCEVEEEENDA